MTLDVRNAFHNVSWAAIADALLRLGIPGYLSEVTSRIEYAMDYDIEVGRKCFHTTSGFQQGFFLGPVLWNIMYDEVLRLEFPVGMEIVGFADDIKLEVYGESIQEVEFYTVHSIEVVES